MNLKEVLFSVNSAWADTNSKIANCKCNGDIREIRRRIRNRPTSNRWKLDHIRVRIYLRKWRMADVHWDGEPRDIIRN